MTHENLQDKFALQLSGDVWSVCYSYGSSEKDQLTQVETLFYASGINLSANQLDDTFHWGRHEKKINFHEWANECVELDRSNNSGAVNDTFSCGKISNFSFISSAHDIINYNYTQTCGKKLEQAMSCVWKWNVHWHEISTTNEPIQYRVTCVNGKVKLWFHSYLLVGGCVLQPLLILLLLSRCYSRHMTANCHHITQISSRFEKICKRNKLFLNEMTFPTGFYHWDIFGTP